MPRETTIGKSGEVFVGEDKTVRLEVVDADLVPVDVTGWATTLDVRLLESDAAALLTKAGAVAGVYAATRAANTQRLLFALTDTQLARTIFDGRTYRYSIKRTDDGSETILAYGPWIMKLATQV